MTWNRSYLKRSQSARIASEKTFVRCWLNIYKKLKVLLFHSFFCYLKFSTFKECQSVCLPLKAYLFLIFSFLFRCRMKQEERKSLENKIHFLCVISTCPQLSTDSVCFPYKLMLSKFQSLKLLLFTY